MEDHPIRLRSDGDLQRSRLTVFFRLLLALPHLIVLMLWAIAAAVVALLNWFATLVKGRSPGAFHTFLAGFLRYSARVTAYVHLLADPFPPFGSGGSYAADLEVDPPERQNRWTVGFRIILAVPALILASVLGYLAQIIAFLGWFACLATGKMPNGMQNLALYCIRYQMQTYGYLFLLTQRYPSLSSEPETAPSGLTPSA